MKTLIGLITGLALIVGVAYAAELQQYQAGPRLIDGSQLNKMVDVVNNLSGNGTPQAISASSLSVSGFANLAGTTTLSGATTISGTTNAVKGAATGYMLSRGATALDGSNPTTVATGMTSIVACTLTINTLTAPGTSTAVVTYTISTANLNMYGWKPTTISDNTLIASTGTDTIGWICIGT